MMKMRSPATPRQRRWTIAALTAATLATAAYSAAVLWPRDYSGPDDAVWLATCRSCGGDGLVPSGVTGEPMRCQLCDGAGLLVSHVGGEGSVGLRRMDAEAWEQRKREGLAK